MVELGGGFCKFAGEFHAVGGEWDSHGDASLDSIGSEVLLHASEGVGEGWRLGESGFDLIGVRFLSEVQGVGAEMGEGGGMVTILSAMHDVLFSAEGGINKIVEGVSATGEFLDFFAIVVDDAAGTSVAAEDLSTFVFDDVSNGDAFVVRHAIFPIEAFFGKSTDFEKDGGGFGVDVEDLGVGGVAIVIIAESSASGEDSGGVFHGVIEGPPADVELMRTLVA